MWYRIVYYEIWDTGEAELYSGEQSTTVPFRFRQDFLLQVEDSLDLGCDDMPHPTPTDLPIQPIIPTPQPTLAVEKKFALDQYDMTFVYVPGGDFLMGSTEAQLTEAIILCELYQDKCEEAWFADEFPQRTLSLQPFWIMETEVTNAQYNAFVLLGGYEKDIFWDVEGLQWRLNNQITRPLYWDDKYFNGHNEPIVGISWYEAKAYARWLAMETNLPIRLPTETEWEKAARGINGSIFPWGNKWQGSDLNYCDKRCDQFNKDGTTDDSYGLLAPVANYHGGVSPYGALDMAGNVWEWTNSWYAKNAQGVPKKIVVRGGSWDNTPAFTRTSVRGSSTPDKRTKTFGLRVVMAYEP